MFKKQSRLPVAASGIPIDGDDDRLDVLIAIALARREAAGFVQRL